MDKSKQASKSRERRLRAMYRRKLRIAIILCLIIGLAAGFVLGRLTVPAAVQAPAPTPTIEPTATPEPTPVPTATVVPSSAPAAIVTTIPTAEPTEEATAEPTEDAAENTPAEVTAEPTAQPTAEPEAVQPSVVVVPFGTTQKIPVQVYADGSARNDNQPLPYETLNFQMTLKRNLDNDYYVKNYGSTHRLEAGTAGVEFELMLDNYQGATVIDPNKLIKNVGVESTDGFVTYGYRLTNAEISGSDSFTMQTNVPMNLYKRFIQSDAGSLYLVVTIKIDGVDQVYKFELMPSEEAKAKANAEAIEKAAANYKELKVGDRSDAVKAMQTRMITKGYLEMGSDDGIYGNGTAEAVKKAQTDMGMEATGVATPKFQAALFAEN